MRRKLIIILNVLFIGGSLYLLIEDYRRVGKFQWVDPNLIEDDEELYLNPISLITIVLGCISVSNQLLLISGFSTKHSVKILRKFLFTPLCIFYGSFSLLVGLSFASIGILNAGSVIVTDLKQVLVLLSMLLIFGAYGVMGYLTIYQIYRDKRNGNKM